MRKYNLMKIPVHATKYWREILAVLMLLLAAFFFRSERKELYAIIPEIKTANWYWLLCGVAVTIVYVCAQSLMYVFAFRALGVRYSLSNAVELFLKRNFLSVFLPAGGVSALAFIPTHIRKKGIAVGQLHQASALYAVAGLLTVMIVGLPVILIGLTQGSSIREAWMGFGALMILFTLIGVLIHQVKTKGKMYAFLEKRFPSLLTHVNEFFDTSFSVKGLSVVVLFSVLVELCGIIHVAVALKALNIPFNPEAAAMAYVVSVLMIIVSPFLRGLGAVEVSIALILGMYGVSEVNSLSATILYRVFEFWIPLSAGLFVFIWKGKDLVIRIFPAVLIFSLGLINIVSVVTPPLAERIRILDKYVPYDAIGASNLLVFLAGLMLLVSSAFLLKGLRSAWWVAFILSCFSFIGHITKALDWEEAVFAGITMLFLLLSFRQYRVKHSNRLARTGLVVAVLVFIAVSVFGYTAFYFVDKTHFGVDFTWQQSLVHTFNTFLLVNDDSLRPKTHFGKELLWLIRSLGVFAWLFLFYTIIRPLFRPKNQGETKERAQQLVQEFGSSSTDYFKLMSDKLYFFSAETDGFIAYRTAGDFAVVLEEPVCDQSEKMQVIQEFELFCKQTGLIPAFYRVDESSLDLFSRLKKRKLLIGQEAIVELDTFSLEGKDKKSLRNGINSLQKKGYTTEVCLPPHSVEIVAALKCISDEWLSEFDRKEMIFSQGMFDAEQLQQQDIIVMRDENANVVAFLNVIPDYAPGECTYDLIRKAAGAPGGCMDALIIALIEYAKQRKFEFLNMGLVPLSGITDPGNTAEQIMSYAYENVKRFSHYKGLRFFKEKFATLWENKYLVYDHDYDLLRLPVALNKVMKP